MATAAQSAANKANAQRSTGPRTAEGKATSSRNALKHGLTARTVVLGHEDDIAYHEIRGSLYTQYQPATPQECMLVDQLASAWWRTLRIRQFETDRLDLEAETARRENELPALSRQDTRRGLAARLATESYDSFRTFFRYDAAIERAFYRALNHLEKLQAARRRSAPPPAAPNDDAQYSQQQHTDELASFRNPAMADSEVAETKLTATEARSLKGRWKTPTSSQSSGQKPAIATGSRPSSSAIAEVSSGSRTE